MHAGQHAGQHVGAYTRATHVTGLTHAIKKFQKVARAYDGKGFKELEHALYEGAQMIQASARANVHSRSGGLARSIVAKIFQKKRPNAPAAFVAIDYGKTQAFYAHMDEYGTAPRYHKSGKSVGAVPARGFMRKAIDANRYYAIAKVRNKMSELVNRAAFG